MFHVPISTSIREPDDQAAPTLPPPPPEPALPQFAPAPFEPTLLVVDSHRISLLDVNTHVVRDTIRLGKGCWMGLCATRPDTMTQDVELCVSDCDTQTVKVFDMRTKTLVRSIGRGGRGSLPGQLYDPYFLSIFYPAGRGAQELLVSNLGSNRIDAFDLKTGRHLRSIGADKGLLNEPGGIAVWTPRYDPTNAQVVVADKGNHRVQLFRVDNGRHVRSIGNPGVEAKDRHLVRPWTLSIYTPVDAAGDEGTLLMTVNYCVGPINVFALVSGQHLRSFFDHLPIAVLGTAIYKQFGNLARERETRAITEIVFSDRLNNRVQVLNFNTGEPLQTIGGLDSDMFMHPSGICVVGCEEELFCDFLLK